MWLHWKYLDERREWGKGVIGWYTIQVDDPANAAAVADAADDRFANSPFETSTETEKAFATGFARQIGNIRLLVVSIGAVVMFTLLLVTGATMASAVRERVPELGVLKTVGFTDATVLSWCWRSRCCSPWSWRLGLGLASCSPWGAIRPAACCRCSTSAASGSRSARAGGGGRTAGRCLPGSGRDAAAHRGRDAEGVIVAIPISYNLRSAIARWPSALVSVLGIAGTVGVFVAMLAMARGFQATLISSGSSQNAMILRAGADSEMVSAITLEEVRTIGDALEVARGAGGAPLVSPEVVVVAAFQLASSGTDANVQVRGVSPSALDVRPTVRVIDGRFFAPGWPSWWSAATPPPSTAASSSVTPSTSAARPGRWWASWTQVAAPSTPSCGATLRCSTRSSTGRRTSSSR